jgi:hypothetical protein
MNTSKSKRHSHTACSDCSVKFTKYYLACPFCDKIIAANLPYYVVGSFGVFGILLVAILTTINQF